MGSSHVVGKKVKKERVGQAPGWAEGSTFHLAEAEEPQGKGVDQGGNKETEKAALAVGQVSRGGPGGPRQGRLDGGMRADGPGRSYPTLVWTLGV